MKAALRGLLFGLLLSSVFTASYADLSISVNIAPPALPVYEQPPVPAPGYIWTPGYWAYADDGGYFWVPGTWVMAPQPNYLWTPGYWGWGGAAFIFHQGYWGPHVGFYGGVNYGYGYGGSGYEGGRWDHGVFNYNRAVNNVNVSNIHNTYNTTVVSNVNVTRVSYNGGNGGTNAHASSQEQAAEHERHLQATSSQVSHEQAARANPEQRASTNHGHPAVTATARPGEFKAAAAGRAGANGEAKAAHAGSEQHEPAQQPREATGPKPPAANKPQARPQPHQPAAKSAQQNHVQQAPRPQPQHVQAPAHPQASPQDGAAPHPEQHQEHREPH